MDKEKYQIRRESQRSSTYFVIEVYLHCRMQYILNGGCSITDFILCAEFNIVGAEHRFNAPLKPVRAIN